MQASGIFFMLQSLRTDMIWCRMKFDVFQTLMHFTLDIVCLWGQKKRWKGKSSVLSLQFSLQISGVQSFEPNFESAYVC